MNNHKKHAIELIGEMYKKISSDSKHMNNYYAKLCAIILCNEIIKNNKTVISTLSYSPDLICSTQYWKKVIGKIKEL